MILGSEVFHCNIWFLIMIASCSASDGSRSSVCNTACALRCKIKRKHNWLQQICQSSSSDQGLLQLDSYCLYTVQTLICLSAHTFWTSFALLTFASLITHCWSMHIVGDSFAYLLVFCISYPPALRWFFFAKQSIGGTNCLCMVSWWPIQHTTF